MFGLLKSKNPHGRGAGSAYAAVLAHIRQPGFYTDMAVPDTFDGRFDLMLLHVFLVIERVNGSGEAAVQAFNQALFDAVFADMDQTLREMGVGDMGIPKRMRHMMKAFNGRIYAYDAAMRDGALRPALARNLYGTVPDVPPAALEDMEFYVRESVRYLRMQDIARLIGGEIRFAGIPGAGGAEEAG